MIGFKQIELSDRDILNMFFINTQNQNSECTFTNLYMWRRCYAVRWMTVEGHLIIEPNAFESTWILPPYGYHEDDEKYKAALLEMAEWYKKEGKPFIIRGITEREKERMERLLPQYFTFTEDRDIGDYIYSAENLRCLKGRKYSKKRNHINAFKKDYPNYDFVPLSTENVDACLDFLERWYGQHNQEGTLDDGLLCEREAIYDALTHMDQLDFVGGIIKIDGQVVALTFGERVNEETVVIHAEKAFSQYRGLYPVINQDYLNHYWPDMTYVNREEDMGLEGLRQAKMSYYPEYILTKYRADVRSHENRLAD